MSKSCDTCKRLKANGGCSAGWFFEYFIQDKYEEYCWKWKEFTPVVEPVPVPIPTPTPTPTPTPEPVATTCTCKPPLDKCVAVPSKFKGGECVMPGGKDIRFDSNYEKLTNAGFCFTGNFHKPYLKMEKKANGHYRLSLPCLVKDGYKIHVYGYCYPDFSVAISTGNVCEDWPGNGTFRWFILWYKE